MSNVIKNIEYFNEDGEEFINYFYSSKKNFHNNEYEFINSLNMISQLNIDLKKFSSFNIEISQKELIHFFKDSEINDSEIIEMKHFQEYWYFINTFIKTKNYYILRTWETTA